MGTAEVVVNEGWATSETNCGLTAQITTVGLLKESLLLCQKDTDGFVFPCKAAGVSETLWTFHHTTSGLGKWLA
jgi:hypothetical protein